MSELEVAAGFAPVLPCRFRLALQCQVLARLSGPRLALQWSLGPSHLRPETNSTGMCILAMRTSKECGWPGARARAHPRREECTLPSKSLRPASARGPTRPLRYPLQADHAWGAEPIVANQHVPAALTFQEASGAIRSPAGGCNRQASFTLPNWQAQFCFQIDHGSECPEASV